MKIQKKSIIIITILTLCLIYFSLQIIRLENYHYAVQTGFCHDIQQSERDTCISKIETRTNPLFHLLHGLKIF
jgi:hypothetical protein